MIRVFDMFSGDHKTRVREILEDFLGGTFDNPQPSNMLLIMENMSGDMTFIRALHMLRNDRNYNVFIAQTQAAAGMLLNPVNKEWRWTSLSFGGRPIGKDGETGPPKAEA